MNGKLSLMLPDLHLLALARLRYQFKVRDGVVVALRGEAWRKNFR